MKAILFYCCVSLLLSACSVLSPAVHSPERMQGSQLSHKDAERRAKQVHNVQYALSLKLNPEQTDFRGEAELTFDFVPHYGALTIDFNGGEIVGLTINGTHAKWDYNGWFITLAAEDLMPGRNLIRIEFKRPFSTDGDGLHRYQDPVTQNVYVYTNFEPFNANKLFPLFDQPDLKARFTLEVVAPMHWQVISSTMEERTVVEGDFRRWQFPQSPLMPSYIFPMHAGPFHVWLTEIELNDEVLPLRLFAREEVAQYVQADDWFLWTEQSFRFFNDYFAYPYPYKKYDQIIVPDFNAGAMENLAAVTFTERFVKRGSSTYAERMRVANVIAHELAHMWFGNLVTMQWWNGLWLNESFATFMAYLQQARASEFTNAWEVFYDRSKQWAYFEDQLNTTHPIELPVPTTADAFANFDAITYGKGASVLKQLSFYVGPEKFQAAIGDYIRTHANGNTHLHDFIEAVATHAGVSLAEFSQQWLFDAGLNTLTTEFECEGNALHTVRLRQGIASGAVVLRAQKVKLALFRLEQGEARLIKTIPVVYQGVKTEVHLAESTACPELIFPNFEDWGYVKVLLDDTSRTTFIAEPNAFTDSGLRSMLWQTVWDDARDARLSLIEYVQVVGQAMPREPTDRIATELAKHLVHAYEYLWWMDESGRQFSDVRAAISAALWTATSAATGGTDRQANLFEQWLATAHTQQDIARLKAILNDGAAPQGLEIDQDLRWQMVLQFNRFDDELGETLVTRELARDSSERAKKMALASRASRAQLELKQLWLERLLEQNSPYKLAEQVEVMRELFAPSQRALWQALSAKILAALPILAEQRDVRFIDRFTQYLMPVLCSSGTAEALAKTQAELEGKEPVSERALKAALDENARCMAMRGVL